MLHEDETRTKNHYIGYGVRIQEEKNIYRYSVTQNSDSFILIW